MLFHTPAGPMLQPKSAPAPVVALQHGIAALADRINSLPRRFAASLASSIGTTQLTEGLVDAGREATFDCGALASQAGKAWENG